MSLINRGFFTLELKYYIFATCSQIFMKFMKLYLLGKQFTRETVLEGSKKLERQLIVTVYRFNDEIRLLFRRIINFSDDVSITC